MQRIPKDITGQKFNRLTAVSFSHKDKNSNYCWNFICDCGNRYVRAAFAVVGGYTKSCGCLHRELITKHGHSWAGGKRKCSLTYTSWLHMRLRCRDPKAANYDNYGGRGIKVCDRWNNSFKNFLTDMGERPSAAHTIDRIDSDKGYAPGNCRWATKAEQVNNRRNAVNLTFNGRTLNAKQWADELGLSVACIRKRIANGWSIDRVLSPVRVKKSKWRITYNGVTLSTIEWAKRCNISQSALFYRLTRWPIEKALREERYRSPNGTRRTYT